MVKVPKRDLLRGGRLVDKKVQREKYIVTSCLAFIFVLVSWVVLERGGKAERKRERTLMNYCDPTLGTRARPNPTLSQG